MQTITAESYKELARKGPEFAKKSATDFSIMLYRRMILADLAGRVEGHPKQRKRSSKAKKLSASIQRIHLGLLVGGISYTIELAAIPSNLVSPPFQEAVDSFVSRLNITAEQYDRLANRYQQYVFGTKRLRGLADAAQYAILQRLQKGISTGLGNGWSYERFKKSYPDFQKYFSAESHLKLIYRQNVQQAINSGVFQQIWADDEDYDLMFQTSGDERVDADEGDSGPCLKADGYVAKKSDDVWRKLWPPLHFGCRCVVRETVDSDYKENRPQSVDTDSIPEDFQNWPGDGFTISAPETADMQAIEDYLESIKDEATVAPVPEEPPPMEPEKLPEPPPLEPETPPTPYREQPIDPKSFIEYDSETEELVREDWTDFWSHETNREENNFFKDYQGFGHQNVNDYLRGHEIDWEDVADEEYIQHAIDVLDRGFEHKGAVLDESIRVWRGFNAPKLQAALQQDYQAMIGTEFIDDGYVSTSIFKHGSFSGNIKAEILVPKGSRAVYLESLARMGEYEMLLARGCRFRIIDIVHQKGYGSGTWKIVMQLLEQGK